MKEYFRRLRAARRVRRLRFFSIFVLFVLWCWMIGEKDIGRRVTLLVWASLLSAIYVLTELVAIIRESIRAFRGSAKSGS